LPQRYRRLKAQNLQQCRHAGVKATAFPQLTNQLLQPLDSLRPVLAFVSQIAQGASDFKEPLDQIKSIVVGYFPRGKLEQSGVVGKEGELLQNLRLAKVQVIGQPEALIRVVRSHVALPDE